MGRLKRAAAAAFLALATAGCVHVADDQHIGLLIINGSNARAVLWLEQEGRVDGLLSEACSASSHPLRLDARWSVEYRGETLARSDQVRPLADAPVTVLRIAIVPDGTVQLFEPQPSDVMPDAPFDFPCADGPRSEDVRATTPAGTLHPP